MPVCCLGALRRERRAPAPQPVQPVGLRGDGGAVDEPLGEHHLQQRQQEVGVAVRDDAQPLELGRGLGSARVDHDDAPAALDDVVHAVLDPRRGEETAMGDHRVRAHHHQQIGPHQIGDRHRHRRPVEELAGQISRLLVSCEDEVK